MHILSVFYGMYLNRRMTSSIPKQLSNNTDRTRRGGVKMWVPRRRWDDMLLRIEKCEDDIRKQKESTETLIRSTAKRILEQPD